MSAKSSRRGKQSSRSSATRRTRPPGEGRGDGAGALRPSPAPSADHNSGSAAAPLPAFQKPQVPLLPDGFSVGGVTGPPAIPGPDPAGPSDPAAERSGVDRVRDRGEVRDGEFDGYRNCRPAVITTGGASVGTASAAAAALADDAVPDTAPVRQPFLVHHVTDDAPAANRSSPSTTVADQAGRSGHGPTGSGAVRTWSTVRQACQVVGYRPHLRQTTLTTLIVGTILFLINHLDAVVSGTATAATWVETAITYLVPFVVANIGLLVGSRRRDVGGAPGSPQG